ncbi:MAG: hypothetical protein WBH77_09915 [Saccharofermentanales bacterium]
MTDATIRLRDGTILKFDLSLSWLLRFERAFKKDAFSFFYELLKKIDLESIAQIIWSMTGHLIADGEILKELTAEVLSLAVFSLTGKPKKQKQEGTNDNYKHNTMSIIAGGIRRGLTLADANIMTMGMWLDYCVEYNNMFSIAVNKSNVRRASQADIEKFIKTGEVG